MPAESTATRWYLVPATLNAGSQMQTSVHFAVRAGSRAAAAESVDSWLEVVNDRLEDSGHEFVAGAPETLREARDAAAGQG